MEDFWKTFLSLNIWVEIHKNFLSQILKIFVTLGINILRFYRPQAFFSKQVSVKVDVIYYKGSKIPIFYV